MAQWREFGYKGEEDTCLWCGKKLRWKTWPLNLDNAHIRAAAGEKIPRTRSYDKPGDYGDGFFCGLRCAYQFAVRLAELGRRLGA